MVMSVFRPDTVDDFFLEGNLNINSVALFLILLVAHLLRCFMQGIFPILSELTKKFVRLLRKLENTRLC